MDVYADIYFIINFSMDFICLYICSLCMKTAIKPRRLLLAGAVGGIFSVISLILQGNPVISFLLTLCVGLLMCYIVFGCKTPLRFLVSFIVYLAVSFFMGGGLTFLYSWLNSLLPSASFLPVSPSGVLFPAALLCAVASLFLSHISNRYINRKTAEIHITHGKTDITLTALADSGNLLCDPISGVPVILLCRSASLEFIPSGDFSPEFVAELPEFTGKLRVIPMKNQEGTSIITAFSPQSITVNGESKRCLLAFTKTDSFGGNDALLPSSLLPFSSNK